uniref:Uncharacterized protein n=1 Tax=Physcomitrium patens TaxID=3218 RepID=A0A2K1K306_PHYPA|nr:hypothetical protein PHYPA_012640 [Physcomitrium patens]
MAYAFFQVVKSTSGLQQNASHSHFLAIIETVVYFASHNSKSEFRSSKQSVASSLLS